MLIDNMQEGIFIIQDGKLQFVNESFAITAGYSVEEVLGRDFLDFVALEDQERVIDNYSRRLAGENVPKEYELNVLHKDGTRITTNVNVGLITYRGRTASMGTIKDITERKRAEKALQYRLEFEKLITSISTNFINIASDEIDGEINNALKKIGEFAGVDRSYVILVSEDGTRIDNVYEWCADKKYPMVQRLKGVLFESFPWFVEKMRRHETIYVPRISDLPPEAGVEIAALQKASVKSIIEVPIIYGGVLLGYLGFTSVQRELTWSEDLTALLKIVGEIFVNALVRKMAEAAVWESEARFRAIFEEAAIGMVLVNTDGHAIVSNPALHEMLGYSGEELREMAFTDFTHPDDISDNLSLFKELVAGKRDYYQMEKRYIKKNGSLIWVRLTSSLVRGDGGKPQFSIGMVEDITERKKTEELLKEKARAELYGFIISALPVFASNIPSQVRNILVKNFAMRFERNIRPRFEEKTKQLNLYFDDGTYNVFDVFMLWIAGLFSNLGIKTRTMPGGAKRSFELLNCPWKGEASGNPIFCLICRTIVMRSFTWTSLKGMVEQKSSIANGSQTCMFEINVNQRRYQGNH
ncbi:Methanogenesis regulatory histidine kinase FilI [uncultured archaeon]|nr:Methanogenesis regulatory histidine kinase FilI [uncultured archaeon]